MSTIRMPVFAVALAALTLCVFAPQSMAQTYTLTDLGAIAGNSVSTGYALSSTGQAAGTSSTPTAAMAVLFSNGKVTSISTLGSNVSVATGINGSGEIVGWNDFYSGPNFDPEAFLYSNGSMRSIDEPSVFPSGSEASAINDSGEVVGTGYFTSGNGVWTDLGAIIGASASRATSVNLSGVIVGTAFFPQTQYHPPKPGKHVPFISTANGLVNLNALMPAGTGFVLTDAVAINGLGQILCNATNSGGSKHAVLLSPK
jgi:probable HAF family extracellular repeat protein